MIQDPDPLNRIKIQQTILIFPAAAVTYHRFIHWHDGAGWLRILYRYFSLFTKRFAI